MGAKIAVSSAIPSSSPPMRWRIAAGVASRRLRCRWHELPGQSERGLAMSRQQPVARRDLLHCALEQERLVGGPQRGRRAHVDLELARARLRCARLHGEPVLMQRRAHRAGEVLVTRGRDDAVDARPLFDRFELRRPLRAAPIAASRAARRTQARSRRPARHPWTGRDRPRSAGPRAVTAGWRVRRARRSRTAAAPCGRATGRCGPSRGSGIASMSG